MDLHDALETGDVDQALGAARDLEIDDALAQARDVAVGQGAERARAAATTVMARLAVQACPLPGSPATDTPDVMATKQQARDAFLADERATLLRLVGDPAPSVAAAAAAALIDATEDRDLAALRPKLAGALPALEQRAVADGDAGTALLRLEGGRAAVPYLVEMAAGRIVPVALNAVTAAVARSPVPAALAPLETLLQADPLFTRRLRGVPASDGADADRVRGLAQAIAAIDRAAATKLAEAAPAVARRSIDDGILDDAVHRLVTASPAALPKLRTELAALQPGLQSRCDAGDVEAVTALLRLGGEPVAVRWLETIVNGGTAPEQLETLAEESAQLGYRGAAAPLAQFIDNANQRAQSSDVWADLVGTQAAAAMKALRVLDPSRATALAAAAPASLRAWFA